MDHFTEFWLAWIAIFIAFIGGIPGIISIFKYYKERPLIKIHEVLPYTGWIEIDDKKIPEVNLLFTLSNEGNKPYFLWKASLTLLVNGKKYQFTPHGESKANYKKSHISLNNVDAKNIFRENLIISSDKPELCLASFKCDEIDIKDFLSFDVLDYELSIFDLSNRKVSKKEKIIKSKVQQFPKGKQFRHPRYGIEIAGL